MARVDNFVSDDYRERTVRSLRKHLVGRTIDAGGVAERVETAYAARVGDELALTQKGLPNVAIAPAVSPRRRPTRLTPAVFSHVVKRGSWRLRRWSLAASGFFRIWTSMCVAPNPIRRTA
jgi:hypothetical protein